MRKSEHLLFLISILVALLALSALDTLFRGAARSERMDLMRSQVSGLDLTDLSLFTEARYIRHLSQADRHTPFQDHPVSLEHFPSGSLIMPPEALR